MASVASILSLTSLPSLLLRIVKQPKLHNDRLPNGAIPNHKHTGLNLTSHLPNILDPVFSLSTPTSQPPSLGSIDSTHHFRLLALSIWIVMGPAPPKNALFSKREDSSP